MSGTTPRFASTKKHTTIGATVAGKRSFAKGNPVKNPYEVLSQKEQEVARVRREIQALLIAIPLLEDGVPTWEELATSLADKLGPDPRPTEDSMRQMEVYYPFVKNLRLASGTGG